MQPEYKDELYWATEVDQAKLLDSLEEKIKHYYDDLRATGLLTVYDRAYRAYYGGRVGTKSPLFESSKLSQGGKQGEKTRLKANHYRNLIRHLHQLSTQQNPTAQTRASNTDSKSQAQTILGDGLLDYYWREKNVGPVVRDAAEIALAIYAEAFIHNPWSPTAGERFSTDVNGTPIYTGDVEYTVLSPLEVIRDPSLRSDRNQVWKMVRQIVNKWDLATDFQAYAADILQTKPSSDDDAQYPSINIRSGVDPENHDNIDKFTLYHAKTPALPQGRMVVFVKDMVLFDGPLPYRTMPIRRLCAEQLQGSIYGYTIAWDLLSVQDGIDELHTVLMSNNKTFGTQSVWVKSTDDVQVSVLTGGMKLLKSDEEPRPIQLTKSAPEAYEYLGILENTQELLSGIPKTVRGNPEANLKSGNALALVVSQAVQFASGLESAINRVTEELGTDLIADLQDFSTTDRIAYIAGDSQRPFAKMFKAEDLQQINRVVVEQVNPLSKTIAGRAEIATNLLQQGLIATAEDYLMVLTTGKLNPVVEGAQAEMLTIKATMEELREGRPVPVIAIENHPLYIRKLKELISSPEAKQDPQLVSLVLTQIQEHLNQWRAMPPDLAMVLGIQPAPMPMVDPNMALTPEVAPASPGATSAATPSINPATEQASRVGQPNMPSLPQGSPPEAEAAYDKLPSV